MKALLFTVILTISINMAHAEQYVDWIVDNSVPGIGMAETTNSSKSSFGYLCVRDSGNCRHYLLLSKRCTEGQHISILMNSLIGANSLTGECIKIGDLPVLALSDTKMLNMALEGGGNIGFSIPLEDGMFMSSRFSTAGSVLAIKAMMSEPAAKQSSLKDETF